MLFFDENTAWIESILKSGQADGSLTFRGTPRANAKVLLSTLQGELLLARTRGGLKQMQAQTRTLLQLFRPDAD